MGCSADNSIQIDLNNERERKNKIANPASPDPNFPDMEEWPGDRYKGIGIKRMKGYKCTLPINELNEMRENFWTTKIEENSKWRIIQQICVFDEERANLTLGHYNFQVAENCVNHIIDNHGKHVELHTDFSSCWSSFHYRSSIMEENSQVLRGLRCYRKCAAYRRVHRTHEISGTGSFRST